MKPQRVWRERVRWVGVLAVVFLLVSFRGQACAEAPPVKCFDATTDRFFSTAEVVPYGGIKDDQMPSVEKDAAEKLSLVWVPMPKDGSVKSEMVGTFRGKGIHRFLYRRRGESPGEIKPLGALFGYETTQGGEAVIRPFFYMEADEISTFDTYFSSTPEVHFALEVHRSLQGTPDLWSAYLIQFSAAQAWVAERSQGGRNRETEITRYDKTGKVISTRTLKNR